MINFELLADFLLKNEIKNAFGIPGGGPTLSLIDAMEKKGIEFHLTHFEGSGVLMASTIGRLTGKAGLSLSIKGPGLTNSIPGISASWFESFPVVHLTEATPKNAPASQAHKRMNQHDLVREITKGIFDVPKSEKGLNEIFDFAISEEPGPVVMELLETQNDSVSVLEPEVHEINSSNISKLISNSKSPIVIAGSLAIRKGWDKYLNLLNIPVFSTVAAKGVVNEHLNHSAGVYTGVGLGLTPEAHLFNKSDLIICLGVTARELLGVKPFPCKSILISAVKTTGIEGFSFDYYADINNIEEIFNELQVKEWGIENLIEIKSKLENIITNDFLPGQVFDYIQNFFKGELRAVFDTGYFCTIAEHIWHAKNSNLCLLSGQGRYMGTCLPMAIGASIHDNSLPTIAFLGDGSIGMYLSELKLAVKNKLPLLIVLMTDSGFGSIRTRAIKDGLSQKSILMDGNSWIKCINSFNIPSERVISIHELVRALHQWKPAEGPAFLEIAFDAEKYESMVFNIR